MVNNIMNRTKKKKILFVAAKANMIEQFNKRNILIAQEMGFDVYVATDFEEFGSMDDRTNESLKDFLSQNHVHSFQISFERGTGSVVKNINAMRKLKQIFEAYEIDVVHAHSPIGAAIARLAAIGTHLKIIYTAHGFHFFRGGPKKNWLFFPVEWVLSFLTDSLITINHEDYELAGKFFHQKKLFKINGVGVDVKKAYDIDDSEKQAIRLAYRHKMNINAGDFVILAVGELSHRKNHKVIIEALHKLRDERISLLIAGVGPLQQYLESVVREYNLDGRVKFLGYRSDVRNLHYAADLNVFPSLREGLGLSGLEALVDGLYVIGSKGTGMEDYIVSNELGLLVNPMDANEVADAIRWSFETQVKPSLAKYENELLNFDKNSVDQTIRTVYTLYRNEES